MDHRLPRTLLLTLVFACSEENADDTGGSPSAGGGGSSAGAGAGGGGGTPLVPECGALAQATCDAFEACAPILIDVFYGSLALCIARHEISCASQLAAQGTSYVAPDAAACADAYETAGCDGTLSAVADACAPKSGARTDGSACATDGQCASSYCQLDPALTTGCGTCSARIAALAACDADPNACVAGSTCSGAICQPFAALGESCAAAEPCDLGLVCAADVCGKGGDVTDACDDVAPCDVGQGLSCVANVCTAPVFAAPGESCVPPEGQPDPICTASSSCAANGLCRSPAEDGTPCGGVPALGCYGPARCADGACLLPDELSCDLGSD